MTRLKFALIASLCLAPVLFLTAPSARAEDESARVERLEKQVKELRSIIFQAKDTGKPVEVRTNDGPDPALAALAQRVDDLEAALRKLQGASEVSGHDAEVGRTGLEAERADRAAAIQALSDRLTRLEGQSSPAAATAAPPPVIVPDSGKSKKSAHPAPDSAPAPAPAADTAAEFKTARTLLATGDYAGATGAFQAFIDAHPTDAKAPEAYYWLGDSYTVRDLNGDATAAFARSLKGWPKTAWAPDAVIKLARSLAATQRQPEACAALNEFTRRYSTTATAAIKLRAAQTQTRIGCGN